MIECLIIICSSISYYEYNNFLVKEPIVINNTKTDHEINVLGPQEVDTLKSVRKPLIEFDRADIQALSASSFSEIVSAFGPQFRSSRAAGSPIFLIDGRIVEDFAEVSDMPPEAISSITVYPEELASRFGYSSNKKVVNIVLRTNYKTTDFLAQANLPLGGVGRSSYSAKAGYWDLKKSEKTSFVLNYQRKHALLYDEADKDKIDVPWREPSMVRLASNAAITGNWDDIYVKIFGTGSWQLERWRLGAELRSNSLRRTVVQNEVKFGASIGNERWWTSGTINLGGSKTSTWEADKVLVSNDGYSLADRSLGLTLEGGAKGPISELTAGEIYGSVGFVYSAQRQNVRDIVLDHHTASHRRSEAHLTGSIDVPLVEEHAIAMSVDGKIGRSGEAALTGRYSISLSGNPLQGLIVRSNFSRETSAPLFDYLAQMVIVHPNTKFYDFTLNQTVLVDRISGGNKNLQPQSVRTIALHADYTPIDNSDISLSVDYTNLHFRNRISEHLGISPRLEADLPSRFERDSSGVIYRIDSRRINVFRENSGKLRWGANISAKVGLPFSSNRSNTSVNEAINNSTDSTSQIDLPETFSRQVRGKIQLALYHTWTIHSSALLNAGSSRINLIHEQNVTDQGYGSRHRFEFQAGYFDPRFGIRFSGNWVSPHSIEIQNPSLAAGRKAINFRKGIALDVRAYINLQALTKGARLPWLKGRLIVEIDNVFGAVTKAVSEKGKMIDYSEGLSASAGPTAKFKFRRYF
jgi:hypothetical protein